MDDDFDHLIRSAAQETFAGWDFAYLKDRWSEPKTPWSYRRLVEEAAAAAHSMLDMGTGGGEFLAALEHHPPDTWATEAWPPNLPLARARLQPLGIQVAEVKDDAHLPFSNQRFDLIVNRHESFWSGEVARILRPGGRFITQQVGGQDSRQINEAMQDEVHMPYQGWTLAAATGWLHKAGLVIEQSEEAFLPLRFYDIGALVYYLRAIEWQVPGFSVDTHYDRLQKVHAAIQRDGYFESTSHRFLIAARKPE